MPSRSGCLTACLACLVTGQAWSAEVPTSDPVHGAAPAPSTVGANLTELPLVALDDDEPKKKKKKKKKAKDEASDDNTEAAPKVRDSAANRKGKTFVLAAELGLVNGLDSGFGAEAGYFLSPNSLVEADYFAASFALFGLENKVTLATARLKHFFGNSFYVQGGAGIRQLTAVDDVTNTLLSDGSFFHSSQTATQVVAEIGIGNRWQFDQFTIGCDWVGYAQPLATLSTSETNGGTPDAVEQASDESNFKSEQTQGSTLLVRFHIGWAF